jgi:hypothetical protein
MRERMATYDGSIPPRPLKPQTWTLGPMFGCLDIDRRSIPPVAHLDPPFLNAVVKVIEAEPVLDMLQRFWADPDNPPAGVYSLLEEHGRLP